MRYVEPGMDTEEIDETRLELRASFVIDQHVHRCATIQDAQTRQPQGAAASLDGARVRLSGWPGGGGVSSGSRVLAWTGHRLVL